MKAYILEDELNVRHLLKDYLHEISSNIEVIGESGSIETARREIIQLKPEIIFLDIEVSDGNGFDLLAEVNHLVKHVIIISGYDQFGIKALKFGAKDYILKPFSKTELEEGIRRVYSNGAYVEKSNHNEDTFILSSGSHLHKVHAHEIICIEGKGAYSEVHTKELVLLDSKPIGYYEQILDPFLFIRSHKSFVVNRDGIDQVIAGRSLTLRLKNGNRAKVAVRKKESFLHWWQATRSS